jgi:hypothetical protein
MTNYQLIMSAPLGRAACTYVPEGSGICDDPAVVHVLITAIPPAAAAAFCGLHWATTCLDLKPVDFHRFGDHCNLPGSTWIPSTPHSHGTCRLPHDLTEDVERFANQPESVPA